MLRFSTIAALTAAACLSVAAETEVVIIGTEIISPEDIHRVIGGRLEYVRTQQATPARASDAAFLVEQVLQNKGFNEAGVSWKILNSQTIRLRIDEGPRRLLGEVEVRGIVEPKLKDELRKLFKLEPRKRNRGLGDRPPLKDGDVEAGIELMQSKLESLGFWGADITIAEQQVDPQTGATNFVLNVEKGELYTIARPEFTGDIPSAIRESSSIYVGRPATTVELNKLRLEAIEFYRAEGYVNAEVRMTLEERGKKMVPQFYIEEGNRYRLGEVDSEGLRKTKPSRIASRLEGLKGEYLDGELFENRIRQIIATGAFSSVITETTPRDENTLDATLRFEEAKARGISLSAGIDSYDGPVFGANYYDRNFMGNLYNFTAGFEITGRSLLGEVSLANPWIGTTDISSKVRLYALSRRNEGYTNQRTGIEGSVTYPFDEHIQIVTALGWSINSTESDGIPIGALGETDYSNPYLSITPRFDYRDSPVLPTKGWHAEFPVEVGAALGDTSTQYLKTEFESSWHHALGEGQFAAGLRGGVIIPGGDSSLPIDLRFFTGGARSVRSFRERELGPRSVGNFPVGGQAYWVANMEYIRPIIGALRGVVFVDAGGLSRDWEDLGLGSPEVAIGAGLRFNLPIGPVRFEYGHNMTRDPGETSGTFHFAIGTVF